MPRYAGSMLAAEAVGNAISDFFSKALESEKAVPDLRLKMEQLNHLQRGNMTQDFKEPLELSHLQARNQHLSSLNQTAEMERQQKQQAYQRSETMRQALANYVSSKGGQINWSDPTTLHELSGILGQHQPESIADLATAKLKEKPDHMNYEQLHTRLLQKPANQRTPEEQSFIKDYDERKKADLDEKKAKTNKENAEARWHDRRWTGPPAGRGPMTSNQTQAQWTRLQALATTKVKAMLQQFGFTDVNQLGDTPGERQAGYRWFENYALKKILEDNPEIAKMVNLKTEPMPEHLKKKMEERQKGGLWQKVTDWWGKEDTKASQKRESEQNDAVLKALRDAGVQVEMVPSEQ